MRALYQVASGIIVALTAMYLLLWRHVTALYTLFNKLYETIFPDTRMYYFLLIVATTLFFLVSGICFIGMVIEVTKFLRRMFEEELDDDLDEI